MQIEVVTVPLALDGDHVRDRAVVVFDVLRATTTITAALAAGVEQIYVFRDVASAAGAAAAFGGRRLLCGEVRCLPPPGFDLGNSPGAFARLLHAGRTMFLSTTNGTRAIFAARGASLILAGALTNAEAVARQLLSAGRDVTLLCAGTDGEIAMEDLLGAGAVLEALGRATSSRPQTANDAASVALKLFESQQFRLKEALYESTGGKNVVAAGLAEDIDFAASLNSSECVGRVLEDPLRVTL